MWGHGEQGFDRRGPGSMHSHSGPLPHQQGGAGGAPQRGGTKSAPCSPVKLPLRQGPFAGPPPVSLSRVESFHVIHKVPVGDSPYVRAKHVQLVDKDPDRAIVLFWKAINANDRVDSALKDMAIVMKQQNRPEEAIEAIKSLRARCSEAAQESLDNVLLDLYKRCGRLDDQILLLQHKLDMIHSGNAFNGKRTKTARSQGKKFQVSIEQEATRLLGNLGWAYMQQSNYNAAESVYRKALSIEPDTNKVCNLGICLMKQGRVAEAKAILQSVTPQGDTRWGSESHIKSYERAQEMLAQIEKQGQEGGAKEDIWDSFMWQTPDSAPPSAPHTQPGSASHSGELAVARHVAPASAPKLATSSVTHETPHVLQAAAAQGSAAPDHRGPTPTQPSQLAPHPSISLSQLSRQYNAPLPAYSSATEQFVRAQQNLMAQSHYSPRYGAPPQWEDDFATPPPEECASPEEDCFNPNPALNLNLNLSQSIEQHMHLRRNMNPNANRNANRNANPNANLELASVEEGLHQAQLGGYPSSLRDQSPEALAYHAHSLRMRLEAITQQQQQHQQQQQWRKGPMPGGAFQGQLSASHMAANSGLRVDAPPFPLPKMPLTVDRTNEPPSSEQWGHPQKGGRGGSERWPGGTNSGSQLTQGGWGAGDQIENIPLDGGMGGGRVITGSGGLPPLPGGPASQKRNRVTTPTKEKPPGVSQWASLGFTVSPERLDFNAVVSNHAEVAESVHSSPGMRSGGGREAGLGVNEGGGQLKGATAAESEVKRQRRLRIFQEMAYLEAA